MISQRREFTGRHMFLMIISFFGVIIAVNLIMATFATSTWTGLVVKNSYVASQEFNEKIQKARLQDGRGWSSKIKLEGKDLILNLADKASKPLAGLTVMGKVYRPVAEAEDHDVAFTERSGGTYQTRADLKPGLWEVAILATSRDGETYEQVFRLIVKDRQQ